MARSLRPVEALVILLSSSRVFFQAVQQWKKVRHLSSPYPGSSVCRVDSQVCSPLSHQTEDLGSEKPGLHRCRRKESREREGVGKTECEIRLSENCGLWVPWQVPLLQGEQSLMHTSPVCHAVDLLLDHPDSPAEVLVHFSSLCSGPPEPRPHITSHPLLSGWSWRGENQGLGICICSLTHGSKHNCLEA